MDGEISDCCVPNCDIVKNGYLMFYSLPYKDEKLFTVWKNRIGNSTILKNINSSLRSYQICELHFHYMCKTGLNSQLHKNSLPTINLPNFIEDSTRENCFLHRQEETDIYDERNLKFSLKMDDFESICRICYSKGILYNLKESLFKNQSISKLIEKILPANIPSLDNLPQNICLNCLKAVLIANLLIDQIKSSNYMFSRLLNSEISDKNVQLSYPNICDLKSALFDCRLKNNSEITREIICNNSKDRNLFKRQKLDNLVTESNYKNEKLENAFVKIEITSQNIKDDYLDIDNEIEENIKNERYSSSDEQVSTDCNFQENIESENDRRLKKRKKYNCDKCSLDFIGYRSFSRHNKDKHPKVNVCKICNKKFVTSEKLALHRWSHLLMECNICHKKIKKTWFKGHLRTHEDDYKPKPWKKVEKLCPLCGKMLSTSAYRDHMAGHTGPKRYKCKLCPFASSFSANLRRHQALHTGAKPYLCTNCGYSCNQKAQLEVHAKQHIISPTPLACSFCPETFRTRYDRRLHSVRHSNGNVAIANAPKTEENLSEKRKYTAFDKKYFNEVQRQYICPSCSTTCQNRISLVRHLRNEHGDFEAGCLSCGYCDKKFSCQSSLGNHIRTQHLTATPYICDICEKAFKSRPSLKEHILIHTGERPHKCNLCPSAFRQHQHLTSHKLRMHDDRKPFSCEFCDKAFKCTFSLKEHVRIHTGETLKCEHCDKTFKQSSNKYKHMREIHNIRRSTTKMK